MTQEFFEALRAYLAEMVRACARFTPRLLAALLILVLGLVVAVSLRAITRRVLQWLRFNALMERTGARQFLQHARLHEPDQLVASLVFWLTWIVLVLAAMQTLGIALVDQLARDFARYLPKFFSAVVILVLGLFFSIVAWRAALLAAVNARLPAPKLVAALARAVTLVAAVAMALEQLEIGRQVIVAAFTITFGALMLALAIAFGLGGRHAARRYLQRRLDSGREEQPRPGDEASHL
jgi:hypothetical protein